MSRFQGFFRTVSPGAISATVTGHMGARVPRHVSSSTSSAYGLRSWVDDDTGETIRRLARGGTARARAAPSGTRRGSAELGCCWWCLCLYLEPPRYICHGFVNLEPIRCEFMALPTVYEMACFLWVRCAVVEVLQSCSSCSSSPCRMCSVPRFSSSTECWNIPVGYLVGDAQCTLCTGPWSSTGPGSWYGIERPLLVQQQVPWPTLLAYAWFDSRYISASLLDALWKNFSHFLREGGTPILKLILRPALHL